MGNIYVNSVDSQPLSRPVPMGIANVLMLGFDDENDAIFDSMSNPVLAASLGPKVAVITSYPEFLSMYTDIPDDSQLKRSVEDYFNEEAGYGVDAAKLYLYRFALADTGDTITDETALPGVNVTQWRTVISPVTAISTVKVSYDGGTPVSQAGGYTAETDSDTGLYTGKVTFNAGFPKNAIAAYQAIDPAKDEVTISYTTGGLETALKVVKNVDVQYVMGCYDNGKMTGDTPAEGIYGGMSYIDDIQKLAGFVNQSATRGYYRSILCALPANAKPGDMATTYGATAKWKDLRNEDLGNNKRIIVAAFKQTLVSTGYLGEFDTAAYMAALIRKCGVREDVGGTKNQMGVSPYDDDSMQYAFKNARICTIVAAPGLEGTFLNFGYTLGLGNDRWINHVRCFDQIRNLVEGRLLAAIVNKRIPYNLEGAYTIMTIITGAIQTAQMYGWCEGLADKTAIVTKPIDVPIMAYMTKANKTPADWETITNAANSGTWTGIQFTVKWGPNTERIEMAPIAEVAF